MGLGDLRYDTSMGEEKANPYRHWSIRYRKEFAFVKEEGGETNNGAAHLTQEISGRASRLVSLFQIRGRVSSSRPR